MRASRRLAPSTIFFHKNGGNQKDDARADDFASSWRAPKSDIYTKYMANGKPANKRMFHLVYGRSEPSGGARPGAELNEQVINVAKDLHELTKEFIDHICVPDFCDSAWAALQKARRDAQTAADHYRITNPLA